MGNQASPELLLADNDRTFNAFGCSESRRAPSPASAEAPTAANGLTSP